MSTILEVLAQARLAGDPGPLTDAIPYARFMGISFDIAESAEVAAVVGRLTYSDMLIGDPTVPALHGGTLGALLESTAIFELLWSAETLVIPKTINITIEYLSPARPRDTFARGIITKQGRRVANVRVEAWQTSPDHPVAIAFAHFLIQPEP
jgi:acyl-coenzyme A thioesterase PaaI-like protein